MKSFISTCAIGFLLLSGAFVVSAQQTQDYFKFDENGILSEFQLTIPDGAQVQYNIKENNAMILYPDGTRVDFYESLSASHTEMYVNANLKYCEYNFTIKDWYRELKKVTEAPKGPEMLDNLFSLREATITFKDNSQVIVKYEADGAKIEEYTDVSENGDVLTIDYYGRNIKRIILKEPLIVDFENDLLSQGQFLSGEKEKYMDGIRGNGLNVAYCRGQVVTEEGNMFSGLFNVLLMGDLRSYLPKSPYLQALCNGKIGQENYTFPHYGFDNIECVLLAEGNVVNKDNKIIAMYRDEKQLDELDMASELAAEQGRIDREKAEAQKAANEKSAIINKYGKKYADAFFAGDIIIGMPWSLVELGEKNGSFKNFTFTTLSIDHGSSKCYNLYYWGFNDRVGFVWVKNGAITSIVFY